MDIAKSNIWRRTAYVGAAAATAMYWLQGSAYLWGGALFILANVSFGASVVVYNSFLPEIAPPEQRDAVSSKGWGIGYIGGGRAAGAESVAVSEC